MSTLTRSLGSFSGLIFVLLCQPLCWGQAGSPLKWYNRSLPAPANFPLRSCAYGNGIFVATGLDGRVLTSPTGAHWTQSATLSGTYGRVAFGNGKFWALVETVAYSESSIYTSTNGMDWELAWRSPWLSEPGAFAAAEGRVLAVGDNGRVVTSVDDGLTWASMKPVGNGYSGAIGNGLFVASLTAYSPETPTVYTSTNGTEWTTTALPPGRRVTGLVCVNGTFVATVAVARGDVWEGGFVMTSRDGLSWSPLTPAANEYPPGIACGNGLFVVGNWCSTDLSRWQAMDFTGATNRIYMDAVTYGAGTFVAVGDRVILQSDFVETTPPRIGVQPNSTEVYEGERAFFAVTAFGSPPLNYQWRHNGEPISDATNTTYVVEHARSTDAGGYDVVVTNNGGIATSLEAQLYVSWLSIAQFAGLRLSGEVGASLRIEYLNRLESTNWLFLTNVVLPASPYVWIDYDSPKHPGRFYRAARPQ